MAAEVYKVTVVDDMGNEMISYVLPENLRGYSAMMASEYGNIQTEEMSMADLPEGIDLG
jgi:hypothetical protein